MSNLLEPIARFATFASVHGEVASEKFTNPYCGELATGASILRNVCNAWLELGLK